MFRVLVIVQVIVACLLAVQAAPTTTEAPAAAPASDEAPFLNCPEKKQTFGSIFDIFKPFLPQTEEMKNRICCTHAELFQGCECFSVDSDSEWTNTKGQLPQCPEHVGVEFYLYTKSNDKDPQLISMADASIAASNFDASKETKFIIHGFTDFAPGPWNVLMKDKLLGVGDYNVILVNWHNGAVGVNFNYWIATANIRIAAAVTGNLIASMISEHGVNEKDVHLIGHSMGGQVVGNAAKEVQRIASKTVGRVTGMDAAGHGFEDFSANVRIDKTDADFVDLYHCDTSLTPGLGMIEPHGHVDFYANDAELQPACPKTAITFEALLSFADGAIDSICSHARCYELFTYSISDCDFVAEDDAKCVAGFKATTACSGRHRFNTTGSIPYCNAKK